MRRPRPALKIASTLALLLVVLGLGATALAWRDYRQFLDEPLRLPVTGRVFEVRAGDTPATALQRLEALGVTRADWRWRWLLYREPVTIRAGEYRLGAGLRPRELLQHLASFDVVQYRFTIVEGWTYRQLAAALLAHPDLAVEAALLEPDQVLRNIGSEIGGGRELGGAGANGAGNGVGDPGEGWAEGWFLPETYAWVRGDSALDLLRRSHAAMRAALAQAWQERSEGLPLAKPYELLTLASIVEKESGLSAERPAIAGVFVRRLQQGWRLETDPTVIYGLGSGFDGDIRSRDLRTDTPYNTYTRHGLPPTPIALPGADALRATAKPAAGSAMFFVADGAGGHVFSDTLEEHNRAVDAYLRGQRQRP